MVDGVGKGGSLAREALLAAMKSQAERADDVRRTALSIGTDRGIEQTQGNGFVEKLDEQIQELNAQVKGVNELPEDLLTGKIENFHEITVQIKEAEFGFRFAMEIRNKLLDAYREVMRMSV